MTSRFSDVESLLNEPSPPRAPHEAALRGARMVFAKRLPCHDRATLGGYQLQVLLSAGGMGEVTAHATRS